MSATMHLYKVVNAEYIGNELTFMSDEEFIKLSDEEFDKLESVSEWSDGGKHDKIDLTWFKLLCKLNHKKIYNIKHLSKFNSYKFIFGRRTQKYIPVDEISYWQGWEIKGGFFRKSVTVNFCVTKQQMYRFMKRYVKCSEWVMFKERFIDKMVEGEMIFECTW